MKGVIHAYLLLAWHFLMHVLRKLFFIYRPGGIQRVRNNFENEGLTPLSGDERRLLARWQSCIGCGLCEAACAEMSVIPENRHLGPQLLTESALRDLSRADLSGLSAEALQQVDCARLDGICPVDIPLCDLAAFLQRLGRETRAARESPTPDHPAH